MPFEFIPERKGLYKSRWEYSDKALDSIYDQKQNLIIDIKNELEVLDKLQKEIEEEYEKACSYRDSITDWDSDEAYNAEDAVNELYQKKNAVEDWIDSLKDLLDNLE